MVVDADVRDMGRHVVDRPAPPELEEALVAGGVELEDGPPELEPLGPLRPALAGVATPHREHRRPIRRIPRPTQRRDLRSRDRPERGKWFAQVLGPDGRVRDHRASSDGDGRDATSHASPALPRGRVTSVHLLVTSMGSVVYSAPRIVPCASRPGRRVVGGGRPAKSLTPWETVIVPTAIAARDYQNLIDGSWVDAADGRTFERVSPAHDVVVGRYPSGGVEDLERAVAAARRAFDDG